MDRQKTSHMGFQEPIEWLPTTYELAWQPNLEKNRNHSVPFREKQGGTPARSPSMVPLHGSLGAYCFSSWHPRGFLARPQNSRKENGADKTAEPCSRSPTPRNASFAIRRNGLTGQSPIEQLTAGHISPFNDGQGAFAQFDPSKARAFVGRLAFDASRAEENADPRVP